MYMYMYMYVCIILYTCGINIQYQNIACHNTNCSLAFCLLMAFIDTFKNPSLNFLKAVHIIKVHLRR